MRVSASARDAWKMRQPTRCHDAHFQVRPFEVWWLFHVVYRGQDNVWIFTTHLLIDKLFASLLSSLLWTITLGSVVLKGDFLPLMQSSEGSFLVNFFFLKDRLGSIGAISSLSVPESWTCDLKREVYRQHASSNRQQPLTLQLLLPFKSAPITGWTKSRLPLLNPK